MSSAPRPDALERALQAARDAVPEQLARLADLIAIPSVSTDPAHAGDVRRACDWTLDRCQAIGLDARVWDTPGHPAVYAHQPAPPGAPTVLVYGHLDVQPAAREDGWAHDPFVLTDADGKLSGRGTTDDKGPVLAILAAVEAWQAAGGAPVGVKLLLEGEEEIGSPNLPALIEAHRAELAADSALISDSYWLTPDTPGLLTGLRGMAYFLATLRAADADLHSGMHGGAVANPLSRLVRAAATFWDETGRVAVDGYWDGVAEPAAEERARYAALPLDLEAYRASIGARALTSTDRGELLLSRWARPTLDLHGVAGGYSGEGAKTIIPARAELKFSCRTVAGQDAARLEAAFREHLRALEPDVELQLVAEAPPVSLDPEHPLLDAAARALDGAFGKRAVKTREGATIPAVAMLADALGLPVVLLPIGWPDDDPHSHREKLQRAQFERGIECFVRYFAEVASS